MMVSSVGGFGSDGAAVQPGRAIVAAVLAIACVASAAADRRQENHRLFASDASLGIIEIDPADGSVLNTYPAPARQGTADGMAFDGNQLWYLSGSFESNTLYKLNPADGQVLASYDLPNSSFRNGLAAQNGLVYILDWSAITQDITVFDPELPGVVAMLDIDAENPGAPAISGGLAAIAEPNALLVTTALSGELLEIDSASGRINRRFAHAQGAGAQGLAVVDGLIYLARNSSNTLSVFDRDGNLQRQLQISAAIGMQSLAGDEGTRANSLFTDGFEAAAELTNSLSAR